jgi:hypothetical protein
MASGLPHDVYVAAYKKNLGTCLDLAIPVESEFDSFLELRQTEKRCITHVPNLMVLE